MRRSLLFIPSNNPGMLETAKLFGSDSVIFDLEDSVSVNEKDNARNLLTSFLNNKEKLPLEVVVRINANDTPFYLDDLNEIVSPKIDTIMLPKASIDTLQCLDKDLTKLEKERKITKKIEIIPIIELASSLIEVNEIAKIARVTGLLLGGEDLSSDLEVVRTVEGLEILYPRMLVIIAAKANKIDAIDTPFTDVFDNNRLKEECQFVKGIGMNAKACIHPNQIEVVNEVFSPTQKEIDWAKKVLLTTAEAKKKHQGVFSLDGKMIDKPVILRAEKIIEKAKKCQMI
ncbi:MAG: HpcH/HpaI aldolase/citrate lyase family protein [Acholeplasmataceae bacterium]|jgi:citrate lyase subunit beta/citryl-CoA lyase